MGRRIAILGSPGSGKSTLARTLETRCGLPHLELDAVNHQPNWTALPVAEFRGRVGEVTAADRWVIDGNYTVVLDLVTGRADTIVFIDLARTLVTARVVWRSLRRVITREVLWNGNRESWRDLLSRDPERNIVVWTWQHHPKYRRRYGGFIDAGLWDHADVHHLRSRRDVRDFAATFVPPPHA